jgi:hypothetical protein
MKTVVLTALTFLFALSSRSQQPIHHSVSLPGYAAYIDYSGLGFTLNGERTLFRALRKWDGSLRVGGGAYQKKEGYNFFSVPIGLNLIRGRNGHNSEIGLTISYVKGQHALISHDKLYGVSQGIYISSSIGYRFQKPGSFLFARLQYCPYVKVKEFSEEKRFVEMNGNLNHNVALSVGWYFTKRHK